MFHVVPSLPARQTVALWRKKAATQALSVDSIRDAVKACPLGLQAYCPTVLSVAEVSLWHCPRAFSWLALCHVRVRCDMNSSAFLPVLDALLVS